MFLQIFIVILDINTLKDHLVLALLYSALVNCALFIGKDIGWFSSGQGGRVRGESSKWAPGMIIDVQVTPREDDWSDLSGQVAWYAFRK